MSSEQPRMSNDTSGLLDLFDRRILWKHKWLLVFSTLLAVGLGFAYVKQEKPIFEVTARMLVQLERFGTDKENLLRTDRTFLVTQGEILRCPVVVENALKSMTKPPATPPSYAQTEAIINALRVSTVDDANVLKMTYRNSDAEHAVRVLHAVMDSYQSYIKDMQRGSIQETLQVLAQHERDLRKELEQHESRYYELRKNNRLIGQGGDGFRSYAAMLEQIGTRLTEARGRRIDKEIQVQSLVNAKAGQPLQLAAAMVVPGTKYITDDRLDGPLTEPAEVPVATAVSKPEAADVAVDGAAAADYLLGTMADPIRIQLQLWQAETRSKETSQIYGPKHPIRRANESQIAMWRQRLQECEKAAPVILQQELAALKQIESHLTAEHEAEFSKVKALDASVLQEQQCLADIERVKSIHDATAAQLRDLELADETHTNGEVAVMVRVIEPPDATAKLVWPRPMQFISVCAVLGLAAGCVLITLTERLLRK